MSAIELREKLRILSREERQGMLSVLKELEEAEEAEETASPAPLVPLEDAKAFLYKNCDNLLQRLAQ